jgi:hypothetical protein
MNDNFIIIESFEFDLIDEKQIFLYKPSNDGLKIIIVYKTEPSFFSSLTTKQGPYNYDEIGVIIQTPNWITP